MPVGDTTVTDFETITGPDTGVEVTRLTDDRGDTIFPYFTQPVFAPECDLLLLTGNRTGAWQLFGLYLGERRIVQLTDESDGVGVHGATVLPGRGQAAYFAGRTLKRVAFDTHECCELYEVPEGFSPSILSPTADGARVCFAYCEQLALSTETGRIYSTMLERLYRRPSCVVMRVATDDGAAEALWGEREWISHVSVSPTDPDIVVFCHEGPWHLVQRLWVVDARTHEVWPLLEQRRRLDRSGHEYFTDSGRLVTQWSVRETPDQRAAVHYNALVNPDGSDVEMYRYDIAAPSHIQTNHAEDLFCGDTCYPNANFADGRAFMALIRHEGERAVVEPLCRHDSSWLTQHSHPHPVFSPDDRFVAFNSDRGGRSNVYRAPAV